MHHFFWDTLYNGAKMSYSTGVYTVFQVTTPMKAKERLGKSPRTMHKQKSIWKPLKNMSPNNQEEYVPVHFLQLCSSLKGSSVCSSFLLTAFKSLFNLLGTYFVKVDLQPANERMSAQLTRMYNKTWLKRKVFSYKDMH